MYVVGENRVRPFVCNAYDCTQCVQGSIHNYNHIKTYVIKQNISSRRAADDRPYGFTFINYYLNGKILPLPVVELILQSVRLAFTERRYNFPLSIFNFQLKSVSRTRQMPYSGEFFIYSHIHFVQALAKIIRHREGLQAFQGEHTYQQQPFQPFQRVFLLFRGMNE